MRFAPVILALPALAVAQQQIPLLDQVKGWISKATGAAASYASAIPTPPNPANAAASAVAEGLLDRLTLENHKELLRPGAATASPGVEEWMVFVTGGNKSCFGLCEHAETEWNKSVPLLAASRNPPRLALLDCEAEPVLCNAWAAGAPTVFHFFIPQPLPDQSTPATTVRSISLNRTSVTATQLAAIHTEEKYKETEVYEGFWHPFDSPLAQTGANVVLGYAVWGFSKIPSWLFMIGISFFSRTIM